MKKNQLYFILQIGGWLFYSMLAFIVLRPSTGDVLHLTTILFLVFVIGIILTHLFRNLIIHLDWKKLNLVKLVPRVLISILFLSLVFQIFYILGFLVMFHSPIITDTRTNLSNLLNWATLLTMWSIIYFAYQFFERYRIEEIKNLRWEASINEIELNKLKSQLNPHFIFNSMNSIRALIDEDPVKAKRSVTQLSNILRNTLMMGRKKTVSLEEELKVVNDFIDLEKTRYEERLQFLETIPPETLSYQVPSLMIQTLVENGIKHGISKLPEGGVISLLARISEGKLVIEIENSGILLQDAAPESGFGIINTTQRLALLYGKNSTFEIFNSGKETVVTRVIIPKHPIL